MKSDRNDWWYLAIGGQTTLKTLTEKYPEAAKKIETIVIEGGNWCGGFDPYPDVTAPTDETNISCDIGAANFVVSSKNPIKNIVYAPVEIADPLSGADYLKFVKAATSGSNGAAKATLDFYEFWSAAARAQPTNLVNAEALTYDPKNESTPMFDPCAVMVALELLDNPKCENRVDIFDFKQGVHFLDAGHGEPYPKAPRSAFSLRTVSEVFKNLPPECPYLTNYTFDPKKVPEKEIPIRIALGYKSPAAKARFFADMASRMAGEKLKCS
jgi:inosine-uridine nucleoside N-ribohydrolase